MSQELMYGWQRAPAHMFLLGCFLEPIQPEDITSAIDWELALGDEPQTVIEQFLNAGLVQYADEGLPLAERMDKFRTSQLREMLRERDLHVSGRKTELIERLIDADAVTMEEAVRELSDLVCTEEGQTAVEAFLMGGGPSAEAPVPGGLEAEGYGMGAIPDLVAEGEPSDATEQPSGPIAWITKRLRGAVPTPGAQAAKPTMDAPPGRGGRSAEEHLQRGRVHGSDGNYAQARVELDLALQLAPQNPDVHFWRGVVLERLGDFQHALAAFDRAAALGPETADLYVGRGDAYRGMGEYRMAIAQYDMAIERNPRLAIAYHNRGVAYEQLGDYQLALSSYNKAVELKPDMAQPYFGRGVAYEHWGAYARAATEYKIVLELSDDPRVLVQARQRLDAVQALA